MVSDAFPWPSNDGYRLRLKCVIDALARVGDLDIFYGVYEGDLDSHAAPVAIRRHELIVVPFRRKTLGLLLRTIPSSLPRRILWRNWSTARARLDGFVQEPYDIVWYSRADTYVALSNSRFGPAIVDLVDLENFVSRPLVVPNFRHIGARASLSAAGRAVGKWLLDARDRTRWDRVQRSIARRATSTVLCSDLERSRLPLPNIHVIPNSYEDPGTSSAAPSDFRRLIMVGLFTYEPNLRGVTWFARKVMPLLRETVPSAEVCLVGRHDERLLEVAKAPGMKIVGEVAEIGPELRASRGVIVPLLSGSGTRIKVMEALAYGLPIVSTSIGCEGIAIETGVHALIADDPASFARAVEMILTDDELCGRLGANGRQFYLERYESSTVADKIRSLVQPTIDAAAGGA